MRVLLVRHASAGDRDAWEGDDRLRPLDERGRTQAAGLVDLLRPFGPRSIFSSPSLRCRQTVEPLAKALALPVQEREELAEGSNRDDVVRLAAGRSDKPVVFCTHGDVVEELLGRESEKGSTWLLRIDGDAVEPLEYVPGTG
jgi:8-oxo-(d)GTP phosphatase